VKAHSRSSQQSISGQHLRAGVPLTAPRAGARVARYGSPPEGAAPVTLGPCHANVGGFDLHAGIVVRAGDLTVSTDQGIPF